jgi:predicted HAD superfamily Cof-like phosphohydrolase
MKSSAAKTTTGNRMKTNFQLVSDMNVAFGNPKGDPLNIDLNRLRRQVGNIYSEASEAMVALGANPDMIKGMQVMIEKTLARADIYTEPLNLPKLRDSLIDVSVFSYGGHHFMGIDADRDMRSVIEGIMTRFVKGPDDLFATLSKHGDKGVIKTYTEGTFPTMIVKSAEDQPDAPKGKFLKSASYREPVFYDVTQKVYGFEKSFPIEDTTGLSEVKLHAGFPARAVSEDADEVGNMEKLFKEESLGKAVSQASGLTD